MDNKVRKAVTPHVPIQVLQAVNLAAVTSSHTTNWWRVYWLAYTVLGLIVEGVALARKGKEDTASETVWWLRGSAINSWRAFAIFAIGAWWLGHSTFGWWQ